MSAREKLPIPEPDVSATMAEVPKATHEAPDEAEQDVEWFPAPAKQRAIGQAALANPNRMRIASGPMYPYRAKA